MAFASAGLALRRGGLRRCGIVWDARPRLSRTIVAAAAQPPKHGVDPKNAPAPRSRGPHHDSHVIDLRHGFVYRPAHGPVEGHELRGAFVGVQREDPPAYALVYGWLGAQRRHLNRILNWYEERGIGTISYVAQPTSFINFERAAEHAAHLVSILGDERLHSSSPILVHAHSNGGFIAYGYFLSALEAAERSGLPVSLQLRARIRSLVVDSAPEAISPDLATRGYVGVMMGALRAARRRMGGRPEGPARYEAPLLSAVGRSFFDWYLSRPSVRDEIDRVWEILERRQPDCPQLYLYSQSDQLVSPAAIEEWVAAQRSFGRRVFSHAWDGSAHVQMFKDHPDEYGHELVEHIVSRCDLQRIPDP